MRDPDDAKTPIGKPGRDFCVRERARAARRDPFVAEPLVALVDLDNKIFDAALTHFVLGGHATHDRARIAIAVAGPRGGITDRVVTLLVPHPVITVDGEIRALVGAGIGFAEPGTLAARATDAIGDS